jgi:hypothetical protein
MKIGKAKKQKELTYPLVKHQYNYLNRPGRALLTLALFLVLATTSIHAKPAPKANKKPAALTEEEEEARAAAPAYTPKSINLT